MYNVHCIVYHTMLNVYVPCRYLFIPPLVILPVSTTILVRRPFSTSSIPHTKVFFSEMESLYSSPITDVCGHSIPWYSRHSSCQYTRIHRYTCTVYLCIVCAECTLYSVHKMCTSCVGRQLYSVQCIVYIVQCIVYSV